MDTLTFPHNTYRLTRSTGKMINHEISSLSISFILYSANVTSRKGEEMFLNGVVCACVSYNTYNVYIRIPSRWKERRCIVCDNQTMYLINECQWKNNGKANTRVEKNRCFSASIDLKVVACAFLCMLPFDVERWIRISAIAFHYEY